MRGSIKSRVSRQVSWAFVLFATTAFSYGCAGTAAKSSTSNAVPTGGQLSASSATVNFGQTAVGANSTQSVTLSSTGSGSVTVNSVQASGTGFSVVQPQLPATLSPGQSMVLGVAFVPQTTGQQNGALVVSSSGTVPQLTVALVGTGSTASSGHSATLSWNNGDATAVTYNVYRSGVSGGPYLPLNNSPLSTTTYKDSAVIAGATYYYVVTETNSSGVESLFSSEVPATIPAS